MKKPIAIYIIVLLTTFSINGQNQLNHSPAGFIPEPPTNLIYTVLNDSSITLSWNPSLAPLAATDYDVYKDSVFYGTTKNTNLTITGLIVNRTYSFTVRARSNSTVNSSSASEVLLAIITPSFTPVIVLSENFDGFSAGGPGPLVSGLDISTSLDPYTQTKNWTGYRIYQAGGTAKIGASSTLGYICTPSIDLSANSGKFNLSFETMAWNMDSTKMKIYLDNIPVYTVSGLNNDTSYTLKKFSIDLTGGNANSKIKFEGNQAIRGRFFLNNLLITQGVLTLPNIHVSSVSIPNPTSGSKTTVEWTVKNDGSRSTQKNNWRDKIWLVPDITKNFATTGYLLGDVQNLDSLNIGESYTKSLQVTIPERLQGNYYIVVTSDMNNIASIDWHPAGDTIPNPYVPDLSESPYPYLKANTDSYLNSLLEEDESGGISDNFNYKIVSISLPELPDLQVASVQLPNQLIADRKALVSAIISNKGVADIIGKSWIDRIYMSKDPIFNKTNAILLASLVHTKGLKKDSSYVETFGFIAPTDTLNQNRFFVETDVLDSVFESVQDNNITHSDWIQIAPNTIDNSDYQTLKNFHNTASGINWKTKWNILSDRISPVYWPGVSFDDGFVTAISLPSNDIVGDFPVALFTLPKLKQLNLYDNQLTEKIDSTLANLTLLRTIKTDSLTTLNLGKNHLSGEIPPLLSTFSRLQSLDLGNNMLSRIKAPLPAHITNLNIQNQSITIDSMKLSITPELVLPNICTYNHSGQSFNEKPYFSLWENNNVVGNLSYYGNNYHLNWNNPKGWIYPSGQALVLKQESGYAYGTNSSFSFSFVNGDANIDQQVDILDVQHSLNYLLGDQPQPFNFSAANTYNDTLITVQDIVNTVNIILSSVSDSTTALAMQRSKVANTSLNRLYIANNNLVLDAVEPVSAMDITLNGISDKQLRLMLSNSSFQIIARTLPEGGTRFIVFSPTGNEIMAGKTIIAELYNESVGISSAKLSDKSAQLVSVSLSNDVTTGLGNSSDLDFSVYTVSNRAVVTLPSAVEKLQATLYTTQGVIVDDRVLVDLAMGRNTINYNSSTLSSGVYLLKLSANTQDKIRIINTKLIISK